MRNAIVFFTLFALVIAAIMIGIGLLAPNFLPNTDDRGQFIYLLILIALISTGIVGSSQAELGLAVKQAIVWAGVFLLLVSLYTFRAEFSFIADKVSAEVFPSRPQISTNANSTSANGSAVALRKASDGHFWAEGKVNNTHVRFMVDTGASTVALTLNDAKRIGLDVDNLRFVVPVSTASGRVFAAPVTLDEVSIGELRISNVRALVMKKGLDTSLLGMSYLGRLSRFEASQNQLILRR